MFEKELTIESVMYKTDALILLIIAPILFFSRELLYFLTFWRKKDVNQFIALGSKEKQN